MQLRCNLDAIQMQLDKTERQLRWRVGGRVNFDHLFNHTQIIYIPIQFIRIQYINPKPLDITKLSPSSSSGFS